MRSGSSKHWGCRLFVSLVVSLWTLTQAAAQDHAQAQCLPELTLTEEARIGSTDGEVTLTGLQAMAMDPDGALYLSQALVPEVLVLDSEGAAIRTIGRAGEGPGEFRVGTSGLGFVGDTLWVADFGRVHFFRPDGTFLRTVEFRTRADAEGSWMTPGTPLADGTFLPVRHLWDSMRMAQFGSPLPIRRFDEEGRDQGVVFHVPLADGYVDVQWDGGTVQPWEHPLFDHSLTWGTGFRAMLWPDGGSLVHVGDVTYGGSESSFELVRVDLAGEILESARIPFIPQELHRSFANRLRDEFAGWVAGDYNPSDWGFLRPGQFVSNRRRSEARDALRLPELLPPVRALMVGTDSTVWVLRELNENRVDLWQVYGMDGNLEGHLTVDFGRSGWRPWDPRIRFLRTSRSEVWGMTMDDLDVPYLHRFRVIRSCF